MKTANPLLPLDVCIAFGRFLQSRPWFPHSQCRVYSFHLFQFPSCHKEHLMLVSHLRDMLTCFIYVCFFFYKAYAQPHCTVQNFWAPSCHSTKYVKKASDSPLVTCPDLGIRWALMHQPQYVGGSLAGGAEHGGLQSFVEWMGPCSQGVPTSVSSRMPWELHKEIGAPSHKGLIKMWSSQHTL